MRLFRHYWLVAVSVLIGSSAWAADAVEVDGKRYPVSAEAIQKLAQQLVEPGKGDDEHPRVVLHNLAVLCTRPGAGEARSVFNRAICAAIDAQSSLEVRRFLLQELTFTAGDDVVEAVGKLLADPDLSDMATRVLLAPGMSKEVVAAKLRDAVKQAKDSSAVHLIKALGELRDGKALPLLSGYVDAPDAEVRLTAQYALARIGDPSSRETLENAVSSDNAYERAQAIANYQTYILTTASKGDASGAFAMGQGLAEEHASDPAIVSAGMTLMAKIDGAKAISTLRTALDHDSSVVRGTAERLLSTLPAKPVADALLPALSAGSARSRSAITRILTAQQHKPALPAIKARLSDEDESVRLAAIEAIGTLGAASDVADLLRMASDDRQRSNTLRVALRRLSDDGTAAAMLSQFPQSSPPAQKLVLQVLADRRAKDALPKIFDIAEKHEQEDVRTAAIDSVARLAEKDSLPRALRLLEASRSRKERQAAEKALRTICRISGDRNHCVGLIEERYPKASVDARVVYLNVLSDMPNPESLERVLGEMKGDDKALKDAAVRALSAWDQTALDELVRVAETSKDLRHQVLALRGIARIVKDLRAPASKRLALVKKGLALSQRSDEKRAFISALEGIKHFDSLTLARSFLADSSLRREAEIVVVRVAGHTAKKHPKETKKALQTVLAGTKDKRLRRDAEKVLKRLR